MLPIMPLSILSRTPNKVFRSNNPYEIITSHNTTRGVVIKPEIFEELAKTAVWQELCEEWWEAHDDATKTTVARGKKMLTTKKYQQLKELI